MSPSKWLYHAFPQKLCVGEFNSVVRVIQGITFSLFEASKKKKKKNLKTLRFFLKTNCCFRDPGNVDHSTDKFTKTELHNFTISHFVRIFTAAEA